jgi:DNA polymerase III epsilon subunit-like protein
MIVLDIETSGLYPEKNSIVSIGAVDFLNPEERFYEECRIWDGAEINPLAIEINGYSEEEIRDPNKKSEADIVKNFLDWAKTKENSTIAGQNPSLDVGFIWSAAKRAGERSFLAKRVFDLHSVATYHILRRGLPIPLIDKKTGIASDDIMKYVGIPPEPKPHIAINGALWELEALYRLIYDKRLLEEFKQYKIPWLS